LTPLFPKESRTFAARLEPGPIDLVASKAQQFVEMASKRFNGDSTHFVVDLERVRLPKGLRHVEHVRGLGFDVWASTHPRIGMGE
jgi:hypothetical protein